MRKMYAVVFLCLVLFLSACDTADTVDEAVKLLQDIEQDGTWETISDGLDALEGQNYEVAAHLQADSQITLMLQVDSDNEMLAQVITDDGTEDYFIDDSSIYRIDDRNYSCVTDESHLLKDGARGIFEAYLQAAPGLRLSSIEDEAEEKTVLGRDAARYELVSKLPDALDILEKFDNGDLRARVDEAGTFELTGALVVDDETGALLQFDSTYRENGREAALTFEVNQWDEVADIAPPAEINVPCE